MVIVVSQWPGLAVGGTDGDSCITVAWFGCGGTDGDSCITVASTILTFLL